MSFLPTLATFSMTATTFSSVGTYGTSGAFFSVVGCALGACAPATSSMASTIGSVANRCSRMSVASIDGLDPSARRDTEQQEKQHADSQHDHAHQSADPGVGQARVQQVG